jgi:prevent-host-death family protein
MADKAANTGNETGNETGSVTASEARIHFADLCNRVRWAKERVVIVRQEKPLAVMVPLEDLALLESLLGDTHKTDADHGALAKGGTRDS